MSKSQGNNNRDSQICSPIASFKLSDIELHTYSYWTENDTVLFKISRRFLTMVFQFLTCCRGDRVFCYLLLWWLIGMCLFNVLSEV